MFEELKELELLEIDGGCQCCQFVARLLPPFCNAEVAWALKED